MLRFVSCLIVVATLVFSIEGAFNSLADCNTVASSFRNTCTSGPAASVSAMAYETMSCTGQPTCLVSGGNVSGTCSWNRKLCVSCRSLSGVTYIRVQTNSLPDHCFYSTDFSVKELDVDFEVKFDLNVTVGAAGYPSPRSGKTWPSTQTEVTNTVCGDPAVLTPNSDAQALSGLTFTTGAMEMSTAVGVTLNGVILLNQMSGAKTDPFYPKAWSGAPVVSSVAETLDVCLGHPTPSPGIYHYHDMSPCLANNTLRTATVGQPCDSSASCNGRIKEYGLDAYTNNASWVNTLRVAGIAKDGRIIYGAYQSSGLIVNLDICNGAWLDVDGDSAAETYAYVQTETFPYFAGCFGPGNYPSYLPECTTNPPSGYYVPGTSPTTTAASTTLPGTTFPGTTTRPPPPLQTTVAARTTAAIATTTPASKTTIPAGSTTTTAATNVGSTPAATTQTSGASLMRIFFAATALALVFVLAL